MSPLESTNPSIQSIEWIEGWPLAAIAIGTCIAIGMTQADSTIASTAVLKITDDLGGFEISSWVFTAYLLTYSGFPIILARISDIFGRKHVLLTSLLVFTIFSGACGASQKLDQLIMFRWLQGLGASGVLAIGTVYGFELRPPEKWPAYSAVISLAVVIALAVAPVIGASLTDVGKWRWIFLINVPIGVFAAGLLMLAMPTRLPREPSSLAAERTPWYRNLRKLDYPGVFALIGASVLLTAALQQAAKGVPFSAPSVVALLALALVFLVAFILWQWLATKRSAKVTAQPILSWDLLSDRIFLGVLLNAFCSGAIITSFIVQVPQRFAIVNGLSTIQAGIRLLPFAAIMTFTSMIMSIVFSKSKVPVLYWLLFGGVLQIAGTAGFSQSSSDSNIQASQYGFQIVVGFGLGIFNVGLLLLTPRIVDKQYLAVANGAINQFRILGGSVGLSIVVCASSASLRHDLGSVLSPSEISLLLNRTQNIQGYPLETQATVRKMFGESYNLQMLILIGIAAVNIPATMLQWKREPILLKE